MLTKKKSSRKCLCCLFIMFIHSKSFFSLLVTDTHRKYSVHLTQPSLEEQWAAAVWSLGTRSRSSSVHLFRNTGLISIQDACLNRTLNLHSDSRTHKTNKKFSSLSLVLTEKWRPKKYDLKSWSNGGTDDTRKECLRKCTTEKD